MARPLRKLLGLGWQGWRDLLIAQVALIAAQRRLRRQPLGTFAARERAEAAIPTGDPDVARRLSLAVERAANHGLFRPFCLVRAIALREILTRHDIAGVTIRVGVRRDARGFAAHAWVRWGDLVLGDRPEHVARFTEVDDISVLGRP